MFVIEGNATFPSEVSDNKGVIKNSAVIDHVTLTVPLRDETSEMGGGAVR